jgi:hypothetical protein
VVALDEPSVPVTCCAPTCVVPKNAATTAVTNAVLGNFMVGSKKCTGLAILDALASGRKRGLQRFKIVRDHLPRRGANGNKTRQVRARECIERGRNNGAGDGYAPLA